MSSLSLIYLFFKIIFNLHDLLADRLHPQRYYTIECFVSHTRFTSIFDLPNPSQQQHTYTHPPTHQHTLYLWFGDLCLEVQCCFTSTETMRTMRGGEPRTATTSLFTQLLSFVSGTGTETCVVRLEVDGSLRSKN